MSRCALDQFWLAVLRDATLHGGDPVHRTAVLPAWRSVGTARCEHRATPTAHFAASPRLLRERVATASARFRPRPSTSRVPRLRLRSSAAAAHPSHLALPW